jgi:hypothetical protein
MIKAGSFIFSFLILFNVSLSQTDSLKPVNYKSRKVLLATSSGVLTVGSLVALNQAWYSEYNTGSFHLFNDNKEWLQMDKAGHVFTTYQMSTLMMDAFDWAGYSKKQALFIGGGIGFVYMTAIECMDGFSRGWGYSWGDQLSDVIGSGLAISQEAFWKEQRLRLKFSYAQSGLAKYNPSLLGKNYYSQILKDYNAQTYWLSVNPASFVKKKTKFPKWLNVAFGYSAYGMLGGYNNLFVVQDEDGNVLNIERQRRFYFSLDVDLSRIKTKSRLLNGLFSVVNMLKFPFPAIEFSKNGPRFYGIYY